MDLLALSTRDDVQVVEKKIEWEMRLERFKGLPIAKNPNGPCLHSRILIRE
jgi:hypothetical protein